VTDGWTEAYYEAFSFAGGDRPLVVSYGSSPPFEVLFASEPLDTAPTGVVEETCFRQIEFAGVLRGTDAPDAARQLVDFLVSERFQREVPLNLFVFPVNPDVELDPVFTDFATVPGRSAHARPGRDRRQPRRLDRSVDDDHHGVTEPRPEGDDDPTAPGLVRRSGRRAADRVPRRVLRVAVRDPARTRAATGRDRRHARARAPGGWCGSPRGRRWSRRS
jgi:hypothetical protein